MKLPEIILRKHAAAIKDILMDIGAGEQMTVIDLVRATSMALGHMAADHAVVPEHIEPFVENMNTGVMAGFMLNPNRKFDIAFADPDEPVIESVTKESLN